LADAQRYGRQFGLDVTAVDPLDAGSVNSNFRLRCSGALRVFARIYEEQGAAGARAELQLLCELAALGLPTTLPLRRPEGDPLVLHAGKPLSFYPWIDGLHLCNAWVSESKARVLGQTLARVHLASEQLSNVPEGRFGVNDLFTRLETIEASGPRFAADVKHIRERLTLTLAKRSTGLPSGLIHGDLFRDNVLWKPLGALGPGATPSDEIAALLDFESACYGAFVYDLMVCVLSWCYLGELAQEKARAMIAGYQSVRALTALELEHLPIEGAVACLRFATTRITDFAMRTPEGQQPARDYRRFLKRLAELEAGVLAGVLS
jgi:homoserine kinase type II